MLVLVEILTLVPLVAGLLNQGNCGLRQKTHSFIVDGDDAKWPWVCSVGFWSNKNDRRLRDKFLDTDNWDHQCGGTIITHKHVLTAAHCVATFQNKGIENNTRVRCGDFHLMKNSSQHGFITGVEHFEKHPAYKFKNINFDVAILFLKNELPKNPSINPICLKDPEQDGPKNTAAVVVGWGTDLNSDVGKELKSAKLQILETDYCEDKVGHADAWDDVFRTGDFGDDLFCADDPAAGNTVACNGDSGGPIFTFETKNVRFELQGIVQGGAVCGAFGSPDIYTNTSFGGIHTWILDRVSAKDFTDTPPDPRCKGEYPCLKEDQCPYAQELREKFQSGDNDAKQELKSMICDRKERTFCCPKSPRWLPEGGECGVAPGLATRRPRVAGGQETRPGEFPFSALIGYEDTNNEIRFTCGGTLINHWYVLTTASCISYHIYLNPNFIRLGEWKVGTAPDCVGQACLDAVQDFEIAPGDMIAHEGYVRSPSTPVNDVAKSISKVENDVALIKLPRQAILNQGVQIACLPLDSEETASALDLSNLRSGLVGKRPIAVGWGYTEYDPSLNWEEQGDQAEYNIASTDQYKVAVPVLSKSQCEEKWEGVFLIDSQMCAGGEPGKGTCWGDGGGPLYYSAARGGAPRWFLLGVGSGGRKDCGNGKPGVYSRVESFVGWIKANLK